MARACTRMLPWVAVSALAGCAADGDPPGVLPATDTACVNLLKDMRQYCRQGSLDSRAPTGLDCLSTRLEFERRCSR